ncbi:paraneoplastic antigen Ma1 homolog [Amia ocellicauda]|uniref:paraneoplastic antigen Ma1 homolog n=1 Tax=Amia ocellicauda TaxID=2972642 RepID=UPI003463EC1B
MDLSQVVTWCQEEQLTATRTLVLSNVPLEVSDETIYMVLDAVKILGKTKIHGRRGDSTGRKVFVLVEPAADIDPQTVPPEIGVGCWVKLDLGLYIWCYRKLRLFSGITLIPAGEEEYDVWVKQATQMIDEWQCADSVKRQRIVESLKGPAADVVRFLKVGKPAATARDYLVALETAYGTTESAQDVMVKFRSTFQDVGEKLSAYLYLDKLLHRLLLKRGIAIDDMNRARMEQVVKGALPQDMVALRLRMTHKLREPPSFSHLLREVREEED